MEGNWISLNQISDYSPDEARSAQLELATRGNAAPEYITHPAYQVKSALLDQWCNTGLLKCAVISTALVSLLEDIFWVHLACHWQRNRGEVVPQRGEVLFVNPSTWVVLHSWNRPMELNQTELHHQPSRLRHIVLHKCPHRDSEHIKRFSRVGILQWCQESAAASSHLD